MCKKKKALFFCAQLCVFDVNSNGNIFYFVDRKNVNVSFLFLTSHYIKLTQCMWRIMLSVKGLSVENHVVCWKVECVNNLPKDAL